MSTAPNPFRRFNGKCHGCKRGFSVNVRVAKRDVSVPGQAAFWSTEYALGWRYFGLPFTMQAPVCKGVYMDDAPLCYEDEQGFKHVGHEGGIARVCECGRALVLRKVIGKLNNAVKCDARCEGATGHHCECACGGKNHGAAHSVCT